MSTETPQKPEAAEDEKPEGHARLPFTLGDDVLVPITEPLADAKKEGI